MLDTNVFNDLLDGAISIDLFTGLHLLATHIQEDEIERTQSDSRRSDLRSKFETVQPELISTVSFALGVSKLNKACPGAGDGLYNGLLARLREVDGRKRPTPNQESDVLIAETALRKGCVLVTRDQCLAQVYREFGGSVMEPSKVA